MEISVEPSKTYAVTTSGSCTVTDADGLELCTASSGSQAFFVATTPTVTISDDGAKVSRATFNYALAALGLLGGGDKLPAGYTRLEFLESTGTQWVSTGIVPTSRAGFRVRLSGPLSTGSGWGYLFGTQNASGGTRFYLAHSTRFVAGFGADVLSNVQSVENEWLEVNYGNSGKFNIGSTSINLQPLNFAPLYEFLLFRMAYRGNSPSDPTKPIRVFAFELTEDAKIVCNMVPALDPTGAPCMFDLVGRQPYYNSGTGDFTYPGKETTATTYSLRRPRQYAQMTERGIRRLYHVPRGYNGTPEEYAEQNGFKILVETPAPEEGCWTPVWHERDDCIELEWMEAEPPIEELSNVE